MSALWYYPVRSGGYYVLLLSISFSSAAAAAVASLGFLLPRARACRGSAAAVAVVAAAAGCCRCCAFLFDLVIFDVRLCLRGDRGWSWLPTPTTYDSTPAPRPTAGGTKGGPFMLLASVPPPVSASMPVTLARITLYMSSSSSNMYGPLSMSPARGGSAC